MPQSDPPPVDLNVEDIRWLIIAAVWLDIAQLSQWRAYRKRPLLFRMVGTIAAHLWPPLYPFPKLGVPNAPKTNLVTRAITWRIW